jgi:hypothetical protein
MRGAQITNAAGSDHRDDRPLGGLNELGRSLRLKTKPAPIADATSTPPMAMNASVLMPPVKGQRGRRSLLIDERCSKRVVQFACPRSSTGARHPNAHTQQGLWIP